MHIPDGLMDPVVLAIGWVEFLTVLGVAIAICGKRIQERNLPRVALLSAGIFVAQIVNFPIGGGTTGHLIGATLFVILAGPAIAIVGMSVVIIIQSLMFGDGGTTAIGLNALNMAVIAPLTGWSVYRLVSGIAGARRDVAKDVAVAIAAWTSVFLAAAACAGELLVSYAISAGRYGIAATISVPAMLSIHAIIGLGEATVTAGLVAYLSRVSPETFMVQSMETRPSGELRSFLSSSIARAALSIILVFILVLPLYIVYASEGKDGLEQTMANAGTEEGAALISSPFSYGQTYFGTLFGGIVGFLVVAFAILGLMRLTMRKSCQADQK